LGSEAPFENMEPKNDIPKYTSNSRYTLDYPLTPIRNGSRREVAKTLIHGIEVEE